MHYPEGPLYAELGGRWEHCYAVVAPSSDGGGPTLQVFERQRTDVLPSSANRGSIIAYFSIDRGACEAKTTTLSLAALSKLLRTKSVPASPCFFNVKVIDLQDDSVTTYRFCTSSETDRSRWTDFIKAASKLKSTESPSRWGNTSLTGSSPQEKQYAKSPGAYHAAILASRIPNSIMRGANKSPPQQKDKERAEYRRRQNELYVHEPTPDDLYVAPPMADQEDKKGADMEGMVADNGADEDELRIFGIIKASTALRFFQVISVFPFATVLLTLKVQSKSSYGFTRSLIFIRICNILIFFAIPVILVDLVLQNFYKDSWVQRLTIGIYVLTMCLVVSYVAFGKLWTIAKSGGIEDGTFSFKPARKVRWTLANILQIVGLAFDWFLCCTMVLPRSVIRIVPTASNISAVPPFLPYSVYFWTAFTLVFANIFVLVLNGVLRGKALYKFQKSCWVWYSFNVVAGPFFMTISTILFMSLLCNYSVPAKLTLAADPFIKCYSNRHIMEARAGLIALTIFFLQFALLPAATFKESMSWPLDVIFVPVYLSMQNMLKLIFCFFFVFFYEDDFTRIIALSCVNFLFLTLNRTMRPCSVAWINTMKDCMFFHASVSSIHSLNLLAWQNTHATNTLLLSTIVSIVAFSTVIITSFHLLSRRNTEFAIAKSFLEIEWEVSQQSSGAGCVSPRALEQLISVTQSEDPKDWVVAKKYVGQIVWLLSYPNLRVQFQAAWALANIALLDEESRIKIHEANGVITLLGGYPKMQPMAQLEALAALANLTLSPHIANEMAKHLNCIPFFMNLVKSNQTMHCVFSCIAIGNLARKEGLRDAIRRSRGVQALVECIMSQNYQKRKYGMFALANMALSANKDMQQLFQTKGLVDRIIKMAERKEVDTQREVVALIRNLACHRSLRCILLDNGVMLAIQSFRGSVYADVANWSEDIAAIMEKEIASTGIIEVKNMTKRNKGELVDEEAEDVENLQKVEPLDGRVDWATWGSKLDQLFQAMFDSIPHPVDLGLATPRGEPLIISLATSLTNETMRKWRDSIKFTIVSGPAHGALDTTQLSTSHCLTYASAPRFTGKDVFAFRAYLGTSLTSTAYVHINVSDPGNFSFSDAGFRAGGDHAEEEDDVEFDGIHASPNRESSYFDDDSKQQV